jgi:hypothetical protein
MKDKFLRGVIAGLIAGIVKDIPAIVSDFFFNTFPAYWDYAGLIGFGKEPKTFPEHFYAIIIQLGFSVVVGVSMVYIMNKIQSKHYLLKGAFFGGLIWFSIRGLVFIAQVPRLIHHQQAISIINSLTSIGYGLLLAWIDHYLATKK